MKKKLSLLIALNSIAISTMAPIACSHQDNKQKNNPASPKYNYMLYHLGDKQNVITNLGYLPNAAGITIIDKFFAVNRFAERFNLKSPTGVKLDESDIGENSAIIKTDGTNYFIESEVKVTFHTTNSNKLEELITNKNVIAKRYVDIKSTDLSFISSPKKSDIIAALNAANGLDLKVSNYNILDENRQLIGDEINLKDGPMTVTIVDINDDRNKVENINVNNAIDIKEAFLNQDLGTIYLPSADTIIIEKEQLKLLFFGCISEFIGDANPEWEWFADTFQQIVFQTIVHDHEIIIDTDNIEDCLFAKIFTGSIKFKYNVRPDNERLSITKAFPNVDLTKEGITKSSSDEEILEALLKINPDLERKYDKFEIKRYLKINREENKITISWIPGSKFFLGHEGILLAFLQGFWKIYNINPEVMESEINL